MLRKVTRAHRVCIVAGAARKIRVWCAMGAICACAGCSSGPKNFENENDLLRRRVLDMEKQIADLTALNEELTVKVRASASEARSASDGTVAEALEALPRCVEIEIGALSGLVDTDGIAGFDAVDVYVRPLDGRRRFTQVSGWLTVNVSLLPIGPAGAPTSEGPRLIASARLSPHELREAYRSSFTGTHYSVRIPLEEANQPLPGAMSITVTLEDGVSGGVRTATRASEVAPARGR